MSGREKYLNIKQLKERGWTRGKIDLWLKEPDKTIQNPIYKTSSPSKLYLVNRVKQQEKNKRFQEWIEKSKNKREKLSKSLKEVNADKRRELIMYINSLEIEIEKMSLKELTKLAVEYYNDLWHSRGRFNKHATTLDDRGFLNRICINMLRHLHEHYEYEINRMFGQVGKTDGYTILRERIENEIFAVYPQLKGLGSENHKNS